MDFGADQFHHPLTILQDALVYVEPPRRHGLVGHDLGEGDGEAVPEKPLARLTLSVNPAPAEVDAVLQENLQLAAG